MEEKIMQAVMYKDKKYILVYTEIHDSLFDALLDRKYFLLPYEDINLLKNGCILDIEGESLVDLKNNKEFPLKIVNFKGMGSELPFEFLDDEIEINVFNFVIMKK